jgi:hypothetical protein
VGLRRFRRRSVLVLLVLLSPAACYFGGVKYDEIQGVRTQARAAQTKADVDRRFPIGSEQSTVIAYFSRRLHESERNTHWDNEGWYDGSGRFGDSGYAYRDDDTLMILMGKLPSPMFGCGRVSVYFRMQFKDHKLASTDIYSLRPDCL